MKEIPQQVYEATGRSFFNKRDRPLRASPSEMIVHPELIIQPTSGWSAVNLRELWRFRGLMMSLAARDVKLRYRQTALGIAWVILQPLAAAGIFAFVFGRVAQLPSDGVAYFLFSYTGLVAWNLFNTTVARCGGCLVGNGELISKVYFPRLILPLSIVPSALLDLTVSLSMLPVLMIIYHVSPTPLVLLLPFIILNTLMLALGIGLTTAALSVSYRDVQYILPVALQMLLYATPIAYSLSKVSEQLKIVAMLNPLTGTIAVFRSALIGTPAPTPGWLAYDICVALVIFLLGAFSFKRMERKFADVI